MTFIERILAWAIRKRDEKLMRRFGGVQWCPWCLQCAQSGDDWYFEIWERDPFLDRLTCGVCKGTSLWRFEIGMLYVHHLDPPPAKHKPMDGYDFENVRLTTQEQS